MGSKMSVLFVSMLYDLYPNERSDGALPVGRGVGFSPRDIRFRLHQFAQLAACAIELVLFVDPALLSDLPPLSSLVQVIPLAVTDIAQYQRLRSASSVVCLPPHRDRVKDTYEYLCLINSKNELIERASQQFPSFSHYAWIDANIFKVFAEPMAARGQLERISKELRGDRIIAPMGRYPAMRPEYGLVTALVWWRFLGGLWMCPRALVGVFNHAFITVIDECVAAGKLTWEVNAYARVEMRHPEWFAGFLADHNQSMLDIPYAPVIH
jgi:hypothetical protein